MQVIACHECDLLQREVSLPPGRGARCVRCGAQLFRSHHKSLDRSLAFTLAAAVAFIVANAFPIVGMEFQGMRNDATLLGAVHALWSREMFPVAILVFLTTFLVPAVEIGVMSHLFLSLKLNRRPAGFTVIMRILQCVNPWGMTEVFMLGVLVALVKLTHLASVIPGIAIWSFGILTLLFAAAASTYDIRDIWTRVSPVSRGKGER